MGSGKTAEVKSEVTDMSIEDKIKENESKIKEVDGYKEIIESIKSKEVGDTFTLNNKKHYSVIKKTKDGSIDVDIHHIISKEDEELEMGSFIGRERFVPTAMNNSIRYAENMKNNIQLANNKLKELLKAN